MKWRFPSLILVCVVLCLLIKFVARHGHEPQYAGRYLGQWLAPYSQRPGSITAIDPETVEAVRRIGTNGIPYLLTWIRYEQPTWRRKLDEGIHKPPWLRRVLHDRKLDKAFAALTGFRILGLVGRGAIPELERLARNPEFAGGGSELALNALDYMGEEGLRVITDALAHSEGTSRKHREHLLDAIGRAHNLGIDISSSVPEIMRCMGGADLPNAKEAKELLLTHAATDPDRIIPTIAANLDRVNPAAQIAALKILEDLADKSRPALPLIVHLQLSADPGIRAAATNAFRSISVGRP